MLRSKDAMKKISFKIKEIAMNKLIIIGIILMQAACFAQSLDSGLVAWHYFPIGDKS